jgi:protein associated with RNAse G/E
MLMFNQQITVNARKYDLEIRKSWTCRLVGQKDALVELVGEFESEVAHAGLGSIARGTISEEFYWLDRWYNVFRFSEPDGSFRNFYCNITMPATFENGILDYVDLDIDVIVWPGGRVDTLDQDDFESNSLRFGYPDDVRKNALDSLADLKRKISSREFPF